MHPRIWLRAPLCWPGLERSAFHPQPTRQSSWFHLGRAGLRLDRAAVSTARGSAIPSAKAQVVNQVPMARLSVSLHRAKLIYDWKILHQACSSSISFWFHLLRQQGNPFSRETTSHRALSHKPQPNCFRKKTSGPPSLSRKTLSVEQTTGSPDQKRLFGRRTKGYGRDAPSCLLVLPAPTWAVQPGAGYEHADLACERNPPRNTPARAGACRRDSVTRETSGKAGKDSKALRMEES
nr:uncharacterized protein LOC101145864 [Gorilla gorilla gorilla]